VRGRRILGSPHPGSCIAPVLQTRLESAIVHPRGIILRGFAVADRKYAFSEGIRHTRQGGIS
jgi:hypothetical protein